MKTVKTNTVQVVHPEASPENALVSATLIRDYCRKVNCAECVFFNEDAEQCPFNIQTDANEPWNWIFLKESE